MTKSRLLDELEKIYNSTTDRECATQILNLMTEIQISSRLDAPPVGLEKEGELVEQLLALLPPAEMNDWWCPNCKCEVVATFHEYCATCGTFIGDKQPNTGWVDTIAAAVTALTRSAQPWVAPKLTKGLLVSMAMRMNHGFGLLEDRAKEVLLSDAHKAWEEVVGDGFYSSEREAEYLAMWPDTFYANVVVFGEKE